MNKTLLKQILIVLDKYDQCSEEYDIAAFALANIMSSTHREQLHQLVKDGPVWDGDVVSKSHRDDLISWGLATKVCFKGEQGYTGANCRGWDVWSLLGTDTEKAEPPSANPEPPTAVTSGGSTPFRRHPYPRAG